jgi:hypothetical protein
MEIQKNHQIQELVNKYKIEIEDLPNMSKIHSKIKSFSYDSENEKLKADLKKYKEKYNIEFFDWSRLLFELKKMMNEEIINSNPKNILIDSFDKTIVAEMGTTEETQSASERLAAEKITITNINTESSQKIQDQSKPSFKKTLFIIIGFIIWGEILEIILKNIFCLFIGQDGFRDQMLKMCGAVWHGSMNYIDWFFRPDFECDSYKFNYIAVHGFLLLSVTLSYITMKSLSSILLKRKSGVFGWTKKSVVFGSLFFDLSIVFLVALSRTYLTGFSPKDNVWMLDGLIITVAHCIALFNIFRNYKFRKEE